LYEKTSMCRPKKEKGRFMRSSESCCRLGWWRCFGRRWRRRRGWRRRCFLNRLLLDNFLLDRFLLNLLRQISHPLTFVGFPRISQKSNLDGRPYTKCAFEKFKEFVCILVNDAQFYRLSTVFLKGACPLEVSCAVSAAAITLKIL